MNRIVLGVVCLTGLLFALGMDGSVFINLAMLILILTSGLSYIFQGRAINNFWPLLLALVLGPRVIVAILSALFRNLNFKLNPSNVWVCLLLLAAMFISFLYVRRRLTSQTYANSDAGSINERQPALPEQVDDQEAEISESDS